MRAWLAGLFFPRRITVNDLRAAWEVAFDRCELNPTPENVAAEAQAYRVFIMSEVLP